MTILFLIVTFSANGQSKKTRVGINNASTLERTMFGSKDSLTLEKLLAKTVSFSWPGGIMRSREESIRMILSNSSSYLELLTPEPYGVREIKDSIVVDHIYSTKETKPGGGESILSFSIVSVWAKEEGKWKLFRCRIINY